MDFKDKKVLVFGSGISGIGACELLEKSGATVILFDGNEKLHGSNPHETAFRKQGTDPDRADQR